MRVRYQDGISSTEYTADLEVSSLGIRIHYVDGTGQLQEVFWAADALAPAVVQPGRPVFLRREGQLAPHLRFDTPDEFATVLATLSRPNLVVGRKPAAQFTKGPQTGRVVGLVSVAVLVLGLAGYLGLEIVGRVVINFAPHAWDERVGQTLYDQLLTQGQVSENRQASAIAQRFFEQAGYPSVFVVQLHVDKTQVVNAYALPGGQIIINEGLIKQVQRPEELAGVLAHELGHVERRHTFQQLARTGLVYMAVSAVVGDVSGILAMLVENGQAIFGLTYSRQMEQEADAFAVRQMLAQNLRPGGLVSFFAYLDKEEKDKGLKVPQLLRTHPTTASRMAAIKKLIPAKYAIDAEKEADLHMLLEELKEAVSASDIPPVPQEPPMDGDNKAQENGQDNESY